MQATPFVHDLSPAQLRTHQENTARQRQYDTYFQDTLSDASPGPELAVIPTGVFTLGETENDRGFGELQQRHTHIDTPFALGRYCVTADEFARFALATDYFWADHLLRSEGRQPVTNIDRRDALAYLAWLSEETGQHYRLPSEAEWEYAARAGSASRYCFGNELGCSEGNTGSFRLEGRNGEGWRRFLPFCAPMNRAIDVGCYPANLWGLFDMHGNVWEFTSDAWHGPIDALHSSHTEKIGQWFVTKGGSWFEPAWFSRSAARKPRRSNELDMNLGFRVVRETP